MSEASTNFASDFLILAFDAPLVSFGGETIDQIGVVRDHPARSMLAGLVGNALGYDRSEADRLDALQARLVHASALVRPGRRMVDYQTAHLGKDYGWTTRGGREGRGGSIPSDGLTHQRYRSVDADARVLVALGLSNGTGPSLDAVGDALIRPERPLFIGRKPNLPSRQLLAGRRSTETAIHALVHALNDVPRGAAPEVGPIDLQWDATSGPSGSTGERLLVAGRSLLVVRETTVADERRPSGVHGGRRAVLRGTLLRVDGGEAPRSAVGAHP